MNAIADIAEAVLNSLWQTAILAFLAWLTIKLSQPRWNAATRHVIWWIVLAAIVILPGIPHGVPPAPPRQQPLPAAAAALPIHVSAPLAPAEPGAVTVTRRRTAVWPLCLFLVWAAVCALRVLRIARSYLHLRAVKRGATAWTHPLPGLTRRARLLVSRKISSPIAAGFLH